MTDRRNDPTGVHHSANALRLTEAVVGMLGVDGGAAVVMSGPDVRAVMYGSDVTAHRLDQLQFDLAEGPCLDAFRANHPVVVDDLTGGDATRRWPAFAPAAAALGVRAVHAVPLTSRGVAFGVLELHSATTAHHQQPLDHARDQVLAQALTLAEAAGTWVLADYHTLTDIGPGEDPTCPPGTPGAALGTQRGLVHRAAGMLSVRRGVSIDDALALLRAAAYSDGTSIDIAAHRVRTDRE